jgi:hypothetical protein
MERMVGTVSVSMPQLGESVTEGTVTRWLKKEGERVEVDEPLLEVSTDKVDTEIPSPASGILRGIAVGEDETVAVGAARPSPRRPMKGNLEGLPGSRSHLPTPLSHLRRQLKRAWILRASAHAGAASFPSSLKYRAGSGLNTASFLRAADPSIRDNDPLLLVTRRFAGHVQLVLWQKRNIALRRGPTPSSVCVC